MTASFASLRDLEVPLGKAKVMALVFEKFSTARGMRYYKSFTGYRVPPTLQSPIPFEETKGLASFYIAYHDKDERLRWFAKILIERLTEKHAESVYPFQLEEHWPPGSLLFFEVRLIRNYIAPIARPIDYRATLHSGVYFEGKVGPSGEDGQAELFLRRVFTADFYTYWPNGRLKQRKLVRTDESASLWWYDQHGNIIEQAEQPHGFCSSDLCGDDSEGGPAPAGAY